MDHRVRVSLRRAGQALSSMHVFSLAPCRSAGRQWRFHAVAPRDSSCSSSVQRQGKAEADRWRREAVSGNCCR